MKKTAVAIVGKDEFGIEISRVVEVLKTQRVYHLPQLPSFISGIINVRGDVIPLIDMRTRFGVRAMSEQGRVMILRLDDEKVGILVDGVRDIINLQPDEIVTPPSIFRGLKAEYLDGLGKKGDRVIILLNVETLLTSDERMQLEEIKETIRGKDERHEKSS